MANILGKFGHLYINTGTYAAPAWEEWECIEDVTISITKEEFSRLCRGESRNGGFTRTGIGSSELELSGTALKNKADAMFLVAEQAVQTDGVLDILLMDGDRTLATSDGWRLDIVFTAWSESQPIGDFMSIDWTAKPTSSDNPIDVVTGPQ